MSFKFLRGKDEDFFVRLEPTQQLVLTRFRPDNVEFCFQFDNNEPVVFATGPNECSIRISPESDGNMTFTDNNNNVFKLFARERNDA
jgi:hypothetical protein